MPPGSNNPFGIKAPEGEGVCVETTEVVDGQDVTEKQWFAVFASIDDAFMGHAKLLSTDPIYAPAMAALPDIGQFVRLMAPHYATDPNYAMKLIGLIHVDELTRFDLEIT